MKKVSLILNIVLTLAVAALFVLFFTYNPNSKKGSADNNQSESIAQKGDIVYIQIDTLINHYDMFNDLRSELEGKATAIQNDLNKKGRALENDAKDFDSKINKGLLTRSQAETQQQSLLKRQQDLQNLSQQKQYEMQEEESVMINKVMDAVKTYVVEYNKTHQYSLIITTSATTNVVLEGNAGLNITQDVLNGLNEEYIKIRNKK
jgi:outer membrane protein